MNPTSTPLPPPPSIEELRDMDWGSSINPRTAGETFLEWAGFYWKLEEMYDDDDSRWATDHLGSYTDNHGEYFGNRKNGVFYGPDGWDYAKSFLTETEADDFIQEMEGDDSRFITRSDIEDIYYVKELEDDEKLLLQEEEVINFIEIQNPYLASSPSMYRLYHYYEAEEEADTEGRPILYRVVWSEHAILAQNGPRNYETRTFEYWVPSEDQAYLPPGYEEHWKHVSLEARKKIIEEFGSLENADIAHIMKDWETMENYGKTWDQRSIRVTAYANEAEAEGNIELYSEFGDSITYDYQNSPDHEYFASIQDALLSAYREVKK